MPFRPSSNPVPLAIDGGLDLSPVEREFSLGEAGMASLRLDNDIGSFISDLDDQKGSIDPDFDPWNELQGTGLEDEWPKFVGTRNRAEFDLMQEQVRREREDRETRAEAGALGVALSIGASLLSPTTLLPGGAIVRGGRALATAARVGGTAGVAVGAQEAALQATQETRPFSESAMAIGGSVLLGGLLGGAVGRSRVGPAAFRRTSDNLETAIPNVIEDVNSVGAAKAGPQNMRLRREGLFSTMKKIPGVSLLLRGEPQIRGVTSELQEVRRATAELTETPLQWEVNELGESIAPGGSVETRIKARRNSELSAAIGETERLYGQYWADGPVGMVGRVTGPIESWAKHLLGRTSKLSNKEFAEEVTRALRHGDTHPIPQVAQAARMLRAKIFEPARRELDELGFFDDLAEKPKNADSYATRIYLREKITRHFNDGTDDDLVKTLEAEFGRKNPDMDPQEVKAAAEDAVKSIMGMQEGENHMMTALAKPTRARVLDVEDEVLEPWLENDARIIAESYFHSVLPDIELTRKFGDRNMTSAFQRIEDEFSELSRTAKSQRARDRLEKEKTARILDLKAMRDRIRGVYGVPANPKHIGVRAGRVAKSVSFMGLLGGMLFSQIPDVAHIVGRNGFGRSFKGLTTLATAPRRTLKSAKDVKDFGAAAEWVLNSRAVAIADVLSPYRMGTRFERTVDAGSRQFSRASGAVPWNVVMKSIGGVISQTRFIEAAEAVARGTATKKQLRQLGEAGIDRARAVRIAREFQKHGHREGDLSFPETADWTDREAFEAFRNTMSRETDLMVITPGQDKPLFMSQPIGSVLMQFKSFAVSANHRILLSGMQRADADVLSSALIAVALGGMVSDIKALQFGHEPKEGDAFWLDALDRSGLMGWLFEANAVLETTGFGATQLVGGEQLSRFQSRSNLLGLFGPSVDMSKSMIEALNAQSKGELTQGDIGRAMKIIPGNNLFYLLPLFDQLERGATELTGARPRQE